MIIPVVFDANTVISGSGWSREPHRCLVMLARRRVKSLVTDDIVFEWRETLAELDAAGKKFSRDPWPTLNWLIDVSEIVEPTPLGKQRSRDPKDDPYLACALAAGAEYIISRDHDLLDMEKPFGIEIVSPREMLSLLLRQS